MHLPLQEFPARKFGEGNPSLRFRAQIYLILKLNKIALNAAREGPHRKDFLPENLIDLIKSMN